MKTIILSLIIVGIITVVLWNFFTNPYRFEDDLEEANRADDEEHRRP